MKILNISDQVVTIYTGDKKSIGFNLSIKPNDVKEIYLTPETEKRVKEMVAVSDDLLLLQE